MLVTNAFYFAAGPPGRGYVKECERGTGGRIKEMGRGQESPPPKQFFSSAG